MFALSKVFGVLYYGHYWAFLHGIVPPNEAFVLDQSIRIQYSLVSSFPSCILGKLSQAIRTIYLSKL